MLIQSPKRDKILFFGCYMIHPPHTKWMMPQRVNIGTNYSFLPSPPRKSTNEYTDPLVRVCLTLKFENARGKAQHREAIRVPRGAS